MPPAFAEGGIDALMDKHKLDAMVAPSGGPPARRIWFTETGERAAVPGPAAVAGYPSITVPAGQVFGLPFGISFLVELTAEPTLLKIAFAFE